MQVLRTPDVRFADLPDFPFQPNYVDIDSGVDGTPLRVHYVDEGPHDAAPVLLMHGEPTWSFLYRTMIPSLVAAGHRVVAPDLVGFGRSDKPSAPSDYSYQRHVDWMRSALFGALDLCDITLFAQDWGSLVGLRLVAAEPERFARVVIGNGGMPDGARPLSDAFMAWQRFSKESPDFVISRVVDGGTTSTLAPAVLAAYDAPFPDERYTAAARIMPSLVPTGPDDPAAAVNQEAWRELERFTKPFLTAFSDQDPITAGGFRVLQRRIPGAAGQPHTTIEGAGHFLQEDAGPELAAVVQRFIASSGSR